MSNPCQVLDCPPIEFYSYTIQGVLPVPTPPVPSAFYNQAVTSVVCEAGDEPTFTGELPGWITFDSDTRTFTAAAGVWGGDSQSQANALAQSELDAFVTANEDEIHCSGQLLFEWQSTVIQGSGTATFTPLDFETGDEAHGTALVADGAGTAAASFNATGTFTWNSNDIVPANMHIVSVGVEEPGSLVAWTIDLTVVAPPSILVSVNQATFGLNSDTDVPFDLPDTGGLDWTIEWVVVGLVDSNGVDGGSLDLTATVEIL